MNGGSASGFYNPAFECGRHVTVDGNNMKAFFNRQMNLQFASLHRLEMVNKVCVNKMLAGDPEKKLWIEFCLEGGKGTVTDVFSVVLINSDGNFIFGVKHRYLIA